MQWRVFLLSIGVLCAQPSNPAGARERLIRADESVFRARALRLKGSEVAEWVTAGHRQTMRTEFSLAAGPDNRMRIERTAGHTTTVQVSDGSNLWTYRSATRDYTKSPVRDIHAEWLDRLRFGRDPANFSGAGAIAEETLAWGGKPVDCTVIRASYTSLPGVPAARDVVRTVWVARATDLILRDTWEFSIGLAGTHERSRITTDYTSIEPGAALPPDLFEFKPPQGSSPFRGH